MKKLLSPSDKSIMKGNIFNGSITTSVLMIICCAVCFIGATWAWFTTSASIKTAEIVSANFGTEISVNDEDGNLIEPVDGKYDLDKGTRYTVTITGVGTASKGYATFNVNDIEYHTVPLFPADDEKKSISFDIYGYSPFEPLVSSWGVATPAEPVENPDPMYPVFDGDPRFIRDIVKLVPVDENSTAMIERNGIVETYNTDLEATPTDVTEIRRADPDNYDYSTTNYEKYYVYGLKKDISEQDIADYVKVTGDGRMEIELNNNGKASTGAVIKVIDNNTDAVVEQFYIIIFGDIDGDADISAQDNSRVNHETRIKEWSDSNKDGYTAYLVKAADLDLDGDVSAQDSARIISTTRNVISIDQKTGKAS